MINKFKNIARRGISFGLAISMMIPTGVYAGTHNVSNWENYENKLRIAILEQKNIKLLDGIYSEDITVNFSGNEVFSTEDTAHQKINSVYENAVKEIPRQYGELNISKVKKVHSIEKISDNSYKVKEAKFSLEYNNNIESLRKYLYTLFEDIKSQYTTYDKIKLAYDYILANIDFESGSTNHNILNGLEDNGKVSTKAYAVLFALIMDELGYENEIVDGTIRNGKDRHVWNFVKVQGKWYHVDARLGDVGSNGDKYLLTSDKFMEDNPYKHGWESEYNKANNIYNPNDKLVYEIDFIEESIGATKEEIIKIDITLSNIKEKKSQLESIKEKARSYKNSIDVLKEVIDRINLEELKNELKYKLLDLENNLANIMGEILSLEEIFESIEKAIKAVEEAELWKLKSDFDSAKDLVDVLNSGTEATVKKELNERLKVIKPEVDARAAVKEAEDKLLGLSSNLSNDLIDSAINDANNKVAAAREFINEDLDYSTKNELDKILNNIEQVASAKDLVVNAEGDITSDNIDKGKTSVNTINSKYSEVKKKLLGRLVNLEEIKVVNDAKNAVDSAENIIKVIPNEGSLENTILYSEAAIKVAETEVKRIKDVDIKATEQSRINNIKDLIKALKAVETAENNKRQRYVDTARTSISNISESYGENIVKDTITKLETRLSNIESEIITADAIALIKKAESNLKRTDYNKAEIAVDTLKDSDLVSTEVYEGLKNRVEDILTVISAKEAIETTEKLMNANRSSLDEYSAEYNKVEAAYNTANSRREEGNFEKYDETINDLENRKNVLEKAVHAMKELSITEKIYQGYLDGDNTPTKLKELINRSEAAISALTQSNENGKLNSRFISSLQSKLKIFFDALSADEKYKEVSGLLETIEKNLIETNGLLGQEDGKNLDETITNIEKKIANIIEATKDVKDRTRKKDLQDRTIAINNVIAAYKAVETIESSDMKNLSSNMKVANTALGKLSRDGIYVKINNISEFITDLKERISIKKADLETADNIAKAIAAVHKAEKSMNEKDTKAAIDALAKLKDNPKAEDEFIDQKNRIHQIIEDLIKDANYAVNTTISSITRKNDNRSVSKNYTNTSNALRLVDNIIYYVNTELGIANANDGQSYSDVIEDLNNDLKVLDLSVEALRAVEEAEKNRTQSNVDLGNEAIKLIPDEDETVEPKKYAEIKKVLKDRVDYIYTLLDNQRSLENTANTGITEAEERMAKYLEDKVLPSDQKMREIQDAVNGVTDKAKKDNFQKRINDINSAILAVSAVKFAEGFTDSNSVKEAEKALSNLVKSGSYLDIATSLNSKIGDLKDKLNIEKLVADAEELVLKAIRSRTIEDIRRGEFALVRIKDHDEAAYNRLSTMLEELNDSLGSEAEDEIAASDAAKRAIANARDLINGSGEVEGVSGVLLDIISSIKELRVAIKDKDKEKEEEVKELIQKAYAKTKAASDLISSAGYEVLKLSNKNNQKTLQDQIKFVNEEISLAEDNIDVQEATRLLTIASYLVAEASTEQERHMAGLAIGDTRRAINDIGHKKNSEVKKTITAQVNSIEKRLSTNNDEVFIAEAIISVNNAAEQLINAVIANIVTEKQRDIEMAIWDAELAILLISDNNKDAKNMLKGFLNEISAMFEAEKAGIQNGQRIINAENAVIEAEKEYERKSDMLEASIRSARLRIRMIRTDGQDAEEALAKIDELSARLDKLEGKTSGSNSGDNNSGGNSSGGSGATKPSSSDYGRVTENTNPLWGGSKKLSKANPSPNISTAEMLALKIKDSKENITKLARTFKNMNKPNTSLIVKGRDLIIGSETYMLDRINDNILVPIRHVGNELGFAVDIDNANRLTINAMVNSKSKRITINMDTGRYYVDGRSVSVNTPPILNSGISYIPMDFLVEHLGLSFSYYIENSNVQLIIN